MSARSPIAEHPKPVVGPKSDLLNDVGDHPAPEDQLGGGDICSPEEAPPTEDDKPLD
jgi:hypothetical protein